jgi:hypothetical protein
VPAGTAAKVANATIAVKAALLPDRTEFWSAGTGQGGNPPAGAQCAGAIALYAPLGMKAYDFNFSISAIAPAGARTFPSWMK